MFEESYGLRGNPFQLTPDPAYYFESLTHRKALSYLSYGLAQGEGFLVITGEIGAGKSTLVAHLMATLDRDRLTAAQVITSKLDGDEMVQAVAHAFGLMMTGHDKPAALAAIETFLYEQARAGRRCLLVVDEAQHLSIEALEELRMLSNFQLGSHPLLQILLLGQPEFRANLQGHPQLEQLRQRVIAAHHLDPLEPAEIEAYITHRLKLAGWVGNPAFDQRVFREIHKVSGGIPRRINQIASRLLMLGAVEQRRRIDGLMLSRVVAEFTADGGYQLGAPGVEPSVNGTSNVAPLIGRIGSVINARAGAAAPAPAETGDAMAQRDAQIAELQQAVIELANTMERANSAEGRADRADDDGDASLAQRLAALESRVIEQERTIRHTLTMLIEWIERDDARRVAA